jgi:hypothetical protein
MVLVERDVELGEVPLVLLEPARHEGLGFEPLLPGVQLDGRAVGVVRAEVDDVLPRAAEEPDVDVRLDVLDQVAEVDGAVGVGQRGGDQGLHVGRSWGCGEGRGI